VFIGRGEISALTEVEQLWLLKDLPLADLLALLLVRDVCVVSIHYPILGYATVSISKNRLLEADGVHVAKLFGLDFTSFKLAMLETAQVYCQRKILRD